MAGCLGAAAAVARPRFLEASCEAVFDQPFAVGACRMAYHAMGQKDGQRCATFAHSSSTLTAALFSIRCPAAYDTDSATAVCLLGAVIVHALPACSTGSGSQRTCMSQPSWLPARLHVGLDHPTCLQHRLCTLNLLACGTGPALTAHGIWL